MPISSHKRNLDTILLDAMDESEVTENGSFGGFIMPQQQKCLLLVCYSRQAKNWPGFGRLSYPWAFM